MYRGINGIFVRRYWLKGALVLALVLPAHLPLLANSSLDSLESSPNFRETRVAAKAATKRPRAKLPPRIEPKIVGGDDSEPDAYPWMVGLLERGENDRYLAQFCGGALIHPYWVLTAAHCVEGDSPENIDVLIGARDLTLAGEGERLEVVEIIMHPDFDSFSLDGDAALLRLATPSSAPVLRVNSATAVEMPDALATILGWGALDPAQSGFPEVLQEAQVPLVDFSTANVIWEGELTTNMLAAGNLAQGGVDSCQGDSGGPLVLRDIDGEWTLAGLTSFGEGCAEPNSPGIYTRVSQIRPWLLPIVRPRYASWEATWDVLGESRDTDNDRRLNFQEFAFATNPLRADGAGLEAELIGTGAAFTFRRPLEGISEVVHAVHFRQNLADAWSPLELGDQLIETIAEGSLEIVRARFPAGEQGFVALSAFVPPALSHAVRPVAFPGRALSTLDSQLQEDAFGRRYQEFTFPAQPLGEPVTYLAESGFFDVRLEIYDPSGTNLLAFAGSDSASGTNEQLVYSATATPIVRVLSDDGLAGGFSLSAFTELEADAVIGRNDSINSSLSTADAFDDVYASVGDYYKKDYILDLTSGFTGTVTVTLRSNDFDAYLILLDAVTGQFIDENDDIDFDAGDYDARITIDTAIHSNVMIRVTTAEDFETGAFTLTTTSF